MHQSVGGKELAAFLDASERVCSTDYPRRDAGDGTVGLGRGTVDHRLYVADADPGLGPVDREEG